jgi:hypothetical protein
VRRMAYCANALQQTKVAGYSSPHRHICNMAFRIDYYKEGEWAGSTPHPGPQHETEKFAKDGLIRRRADFYRIIDVDGSNAEVASGRRDG